jgi:hypothetical protein
MKKHPRADQPLDQEPSRAASASRFYIELERLLALGKTSPDRQAAILQMEEWLDKQRWKPGPVPWWGAITRPASFIMYLRGLRCQEPDDRLEQRLAVICFGADIGQWERVRLQRLVDAGAVTRWELFKLLTSGGCRLDASGAIEPVEPSSVIVFSGAVIIGALLMTGGWLLIAAACALLDGCFPACAALGVAVVLVLLTHVAYLTNSVTLGRQASARKLRRLVEIAPTSSMHKQSA